MALLAHQASQARDAGGSRTSRLSQDFLQIIGAIAHLGGNDQHDPLRFQPRIERSRASRVTGHHGTGHRSGRWKAHNMGHPIFVIETGVVAPGVMCLSFVLCD